MFIPIQGFIKSHPKVLKCVNSLYIHIFSHYFCKIIWYQFVYCMKQIKIICIRSAFIINLLYLHHLHNSFTLSFIVSTSICRSEWLIDNAVSSAKSLIFSGPTARYISLMYNEKREGLGLTLAVHQQITFFMDELIPFTTVYCCRSDKYDLKKLLLACPLIPYWSSFSRSILWSTVSKA